MMKGLVPKSEHWHVKQLPDLQALMKRYEAIAARFAQKDKQAFKLSLAAQSQSFALADIKHTYDQLINVSSLVITVASVD